MTFMLWALNPNQRIDAFISVLCNLTLRGWGATIPQKPGESSYPFIGQRSCCQSNQEFLSGGQNLCCFAESPACTEWCKMDIKFFSWCKQLYLSHYLMDLRVTEHCVMARPWYVWILFICLSEVAMPSNWLFHVKNTCLKEITGHYIKRTSRKQKINDWITK